MIFISDNCPGKPLSFGKDGVVFTYSKAGDVKNDIHLTLGEFLNEGNLISFIDDEEKRGNKNSENDLIFAISAKTEKSDCKIQTGNYLGRIKIDGVSIDIASRFGDNFLKRMLNFVNDVYLDDLSVFNGEVSNAGTSKFILYYLFVQSLDKAYLLGLPKTYQTKKYHGVKIHGRIDITQSIIKDTPFIGKFSSQSRELTEVQEIIDVLYKTIKLIESDLSSFSGITRNIAHIKRHLKSIRSKNYIGANVIDRLMISKSLANPIFKPYRNVLRYAKYIIQLKSMEDALEDGGGKSIGFLINVAELFEIYVTKLLRNNFSGWDIWSPKINVFRDMFYERRIIPDIVMRSKCGVMVFDTKYKRMEFKGVTTHGYHDLDRVDFFQINTYMAYYKQSGEQLLGGGLLYPLAEAIEVERSHSPSWLDDASTFFAIDGILATGDIIANEQEFVNRIITLIKESQPANSLVEVIA